MQVEVDVVAFLLSMTVVPLLTGAVGYLMGLGRGMEFRSTVEEAAEKLKPVRDWRCRMPPSERSRMLKPRRRTLKGRSDD